MGLHTNNKLRIVNVNKPHQALGNSLLHCLDVMHLQGVTILLHLIVKTKFDL